MVSKVGVFGVNSDIHFVAGGGSHFNIYTICFADGFHFNFFFNFITFYFLVRVAFLESIF
jgi:hypothetical protein